MTLLLNCQSLSKSFGTKRLFQNLSFNIFENDRIGLIGANGSGKSTLLKILVNQESLDSGIIAAKNYLKIGYVPQECSFPALSPREILLKSLKSLGNEYVVDMYLSKLGFTGKEDNAALLSGGWKKRLSIAQELILSPDLLLLDEPTNHLDLEGVLWLEDFLLHEAPTYLIVSHDRRFLKKAVNRMIEMDSAYPQGQFSISGSYEKFIEKKEQFLEGQLEQERALKGIAKREQEWLKKSPKARTTKSQARIEQAHEIFGDLQELQKRNQKKRTDLNFLSSERETRKLLVAKNISKDIHGRLLFKHLDLFLSPETRLGLIGSNGSGKTTLLRLIQGEILPDLGTIKRADNLKVVYFDQHRTQLPDNMSLKEALSPQGDYVTYNGQSIHINGWCKRFLFSPDILDRPIKSLSGGEKARISIAHLMLQTADVLLLDEPTNDLDIDTLEILEESLKEFSGAVVLITHDRDMLDHICNHILVLGKSEVPSFYSDYAQWEASLKNEKKVSKSSPKEQTRDEVTKKQKLNYLEKKEYEGLENNILAKEKELAETSSLLHSSDVINDPSKLQKLCQKAAVLEKEIENLYLRFEELGKKI